MPLFLTLCRITSTVQHVWNDLFGSPRSSALDSDISKIRKGFHPWMSQMCMPGPGFFVQFEISIDLPKLRPPFGGIPSLSSDEPMIFQNSGKIPRMIDCIPQFESIQRSRVVGFFGLPMYSSRWWQGMAFAFRRMKGLQGVSESSLEQAPLAFVIRPRDIWVRSEAKCGFHMNYCVVVCLRSYLARFG